MKKLKEADIRSMNNVDIHEILSVYIENVKRDQVCDMSNQKICYLKSMLGMFFADVEAFIEMDILDMLQKNGGRIMRILHAGQQEVKKEIKNESNGSD